MFNRNIEFVRKRFDGPLAYYGAKGIAPEISMIRIDEELVNGQGVYNFNLKKEILDASEKNLKRNDLFIVVGMGVFLTLKDSTKPGTEVLYPFVQKENTTAGIPGFKTDDIEALYNGELHIATGTTVNINAMPMQLFKRVPCRQTELLNNGQALVSNGVKPSIDLDRDLQLMAEELVFAGTQDHKVQVSFPTFASSDYTTSAANTKGYVSFIAVGYRVIGGTSETYKNDPTNPYADCI